MEIGSLQLAGTEDSEAWAWGECSKAWHQAMRRAPPRCEDGSRTNVAMSPQWALLSGFDMTEIDLLARSSFAWIDLFGDGASLVANGFNAWAGAFFLNGRWYAIGGAQYKRSRLLAMGEELICLAAADDWLNTNESDESAHKTKGWLNQPPTERQLVWLPPECRSHSSR